jgi:2-desacetyl-2-hydroxyethyl bacteriochlorophyllide A dehydrogenase
MAFCELGEPPPVGPGQALLGTLYSGITNGTERHALMGDHGYGGGYPGRHGYQHVCRVEAVGDGVDAVQVGEVMFLGLYTGHRGWHVVSALPQPPLAIRLPAGLDSAPCALLGVAGVGLRAVRRGRVSAGQRVWVVGLGPIGGSAAQCARAVGAHVTASDRVDARLEAGRELGLHCVVDMRADDAWQRLSEGGPYEVVIDGSGYPRLFFDICERGLLAHSGVILSIAVRGETVFPWSMLHGTEASIEVSCHFSTDDLSCLLHLLRTGLVRLDPIISHQVPVSEAPAIYATMRDDPRALYGVVFDWQ